MSKYFLTAKELIPYVKTYFKDIDTYDVIAIDTRKSLPEMVVEAKLFKTIKEAKKNGFDGDPEAALVTYEVGKRIITILV